MSGSIETLGSLLESRAHERGDALAMAQLGNDGSIVESRSFTDLHRNALRLASALRSRDNGARVVLAPSAPIAFVEGFFGLVCAGLIPVPAPAPRTEAARHRILAQARDCDASWALVGDAEVRLLGSRSADDAGLTFTSIEALLANASGPAEIGVARPDDTAFLQYTSGSTSSPRGAIVTHRSVLTNESQIAAGFGHDASTVFGNWLPLFHDMGLIGGVLQPFYLGVPCYHLTPLQFHAQPARWLHAISRYGITTTGGPNFAYDACVDRIPPAARTFDLSSWKVAFNGAEPVSARTLRRFVSAFEPSGFLVSSFLPCYGMAEATLYVSGVPAGRGRLHPDDGVVSCGVRPPGVTCVIADRQSGALVPEDEEGEILIAGDNVSKSYWREDPQVRERRFVEHAVDGRALSFLRSGDLGFLRGGELFVTGRIKDLIIREGRNIYPSDLELAAREAHVSPKRTTAAAFALDDGSIVVLAECAGDDEAALDAIAANVRTRVLDRCGVHAEVVGLLLRGRLPVTTSGKVRRGECRRLFEQGGFERIHVNRGGAAPARSALDGGPPMAAVVEFTAAFLSERLGRTVRVEDLAASTADLGLDSIAAVALGIGLSRLFGTDVSAAALLSAPRLIDFLEGLATQPAPPPEPGLDPSRISATSEALLVLAQRESSQASGIVSVAFDLPRDLPRQRIELAVMRSIRRHPALRSRFVRGPEGFSIAPLESDAPALVAFEAADDDLPRHLERTANASFDLFAEAPLRVYVYSSGSGRQTIQFVMHHAAVDLWSLTIVMAEFCRELAGRAAPDAEVAAGAGRRFSPRERDAALEYWRETLPDTIEHIRLPRPRTPGGAAVGRFLPFEIGETDTARLVQYARARQCSLVAVLLAAYQSALAVHTGERRVITTVPFHGREGAAAQAAVGCFVNPLPVVTDVAAGDSLDTLVSRVQAAILKLFELQVVPIAEAGLDVQRDGHHSPLLQFGFAPLSAGMEQDDEVTALAVRGFEQPVVVEGLELRPRSVKRFTPAADMLFSVARLRGGLVGALELDAARIDAGFAAAVLALTGDVLRGIAADPAHGALAAFRVDPQQCGWAPPRMLSGPPPHVDVHSLFHLIDGRRQRWNDACAIEHGGLRWSYADLLSRAGIAAARLQHHGVHPGDRVVIQSEITPASVAVALGLWACGAAYCPIDPLYPMERRHAILDRLAAKLVVTEPEAWLETGADALEPSTVPAPADLRPLPAYVIFTSGSTGRPKGVLVSHGAIANTIGAQRIFEVGPGVRVLQACSPGFDASLFEIVLALAFGGTLVLPERRLTDDGTLVRAWEQLRPDIAVLPPTMAAALGDVTPPSQLILAGEPCPVSLVDRWAERCRLYNAYGPTETAIWATVEPLTSRGAFPYVGRPIDGVTVAVVDQQLRPLPAGAPGELVIGGHGVSMEYLGEPGLTAEHFVNPDARAGVVYRSGDRARITDDGRVEFLGRIDRQIKRNGVRVELGEIEAVIERATGVAQAIAIDVPTARGTQIAAFVRPGGSGIRETELREHIARFLPPPFMPSAIEFLEALPLDAHGKVDVGTLRRSLAGAEKFVAHDEGLDTPLLRTIAGVCEEVFGAAPTSTRDNLLALGVHSLNVARFVSRLSAAVQRDIPLSLTFEQPVVGDFAGAVERLAPLPPASNDADGLEAGNGDARSEYRLTSVQRDLWYVGELGGHADYAIALAFSITGPLDATLLQCAFDHVVASHPSLRASIVDRDGEPHQVFEEAAPGVLAIFPLEHVADSFAAARRDMEERLAAPRGPHTYRLRATLYRLSAHDHVLGLIGHHIFIDGWSMGQLLEDLGRAYGALLKNATPPLIGRAAALRRHIEAQTARGAFHAPLQQWRELLAGAESGQTYLADRDAASQPAPPHISLFSIPPAGRTALVAAAQAASVSLFSVVTAALAAVAARQQGAPATIVSVIAANRDTPERQSLIGCLATTLPIRVELSPGLDAVAFWRAVHRQILVASSISGPAVSEIGAVLPELHAERRSPLLSTMVVQNDRAFYDLRLGDTGVRAETLPWRFTQGPRADLLLEVTDTEGQLVLRLEADSALLTGRRAERIGAELEYVLNRWAEGARQTLSDLDVLAPAERDLVVRGFNATAQPYDLESPLHRLVEVAVDRWPDACAISSEGVAISYRQFEQKVNRLANALVAAGLRPGAPVGVSSPPGLGLVVALHGVMKAGGAYVALDPASPADRLAWSVNHLGIRWVVGESRVELWQSLGVPHVLLPLLDAGDDRRPGIAVTRHDPAYILFTSGSTGRPKAAINRHESIVNRLRWMQDAMPLDVGDRVLQKTSFAFDVSVWEFFWPLTVGATLCTLRPGQNLDASELYSTLERERISTVHFVPSALADFLQSRSDFELPDLRRVVLSGEELTPALRDATLEALDVELHNLYGPTEAAVDVTHWRCRRSDGPGRVPIGAPIANTQIYVLDERGHPSPVGAPGEIFIGGIQVGSGYAGDEAETRKRFGSNPFDAAPSSRLYRTGDAGRWTEEGCVEFLGRLDDQIKIRGIRVEPGEVVAAMRQLPGVLDAAVLVLGSGSRRRLAGFVVRKANDPMDAADMRRRLSEWLPSALVPAAIVAVERLPLRPSGKIDNAALARLAGAAEVARDLEPPSSEMEKTILGIWREVLGGGQIGVVDNFFDVGGNSALLMQVQTRLARTLRRTVAVVDLLENPTVRKLAQAMVGDREQSPDRAADASAAMRAGASRLARLAALQRDRR